MNYRTQTIRDLRKLLDNNEIKSDNLFDKASSLAHLYQADYNSFVTILEKDTEKQENTEKTILTDIPYALKDNISTKDILTTASSNILKDYVPIYDATVYKKLKQAGARLVGKTVLDELAMGGTGTTAHTGVVKNPWNKDRLIGGSSAGSAAAVALGIVPFTIGTDTGDSIRKPASFGGVVGFKPTYGRVSRYGLFAFASSLDHVGCFTRNVEDTAIVMDIIKGHDPLDMTSLADDNISYQENLTKEIKGRKLFYLKDICNPDNYKDTNDKEVIETLQKFQETIQKCREIGFQVEEVEIDKNLLNALYPTYMSISCAEATSNNANLTGLQFGVRGDGKNINEIITDARTKGFSELIKRRFILGNYILQKENKEKLYNNACRIRRMIVDKMNELFKEYDGFIMPSSGGIAPSFDSVSDVLSDRYLILENHLVIGNFGGFPSITIPSGFVNNMPISINITGRALEDDVVLNMAYHIENILGYKNQVARGDENV